MNVQKRPPTIFSSLCDTYMNILYLKQLYALSYDFIVYYAFFCSYELRILYDFCAYIPINIKKSYEIS